MRVPAEFVRRDRRCQTGTEKAKKIVQTIQITYKNDSRFVLTFTWSL